MKKPKVRKPKPKAKPPKLKAKAKPLPPRKRRASELAKGTRWTLHHAAREFGCHREIMERQRRALHIEPGADGMFSTRQITAMVFGDRQAAETRRAEAEAEGAQRRNLREAGELIPTTVAVGLVEPIMVVIRQKICASSLTDAEKDDMLADMERAKDLDWGRAAREAAK